MPMYDVAVQVIFNKPPPLSKSGCLPYFIIAVCTRVFSLCLVVLVLNKKVKVSITVSKIFGTGKTYQYRYRLKYWVPSHTAEIFIQVTFLKSESSKEQASNLVRGAWCVSWKQDASALTAAPSLSAKSDGSCQPNFFWNILISKRIIKTQGGKGDMVTFRLPERFDHVNLVSILEL